MVEFKHRNKECKILNEACLKHKKTPEVRNTLCKSSQYNFINCTRELIDSHMYTGTLRLHAALNRNERYTDVSAMA